MLTSVMIHSFLLVVVGGVGAVRVGLGGDGDSRHQAERNVVMILS